MNKHSLLNGMQRIPLKRYYSNFQLIRVLALAVHFEKNIPFKHHEDLE